MLNWKILKDLGKRLKEDPVLTSGPFSELR